MNQIGFDRSDLVEFYDRRRNRLVGWSGVGCYHPLVSYLKWVMDDASRIYVCGEYVEVTVDNLTYKLPTNAKLRTFIWRINATIPFGVPIFGGNALTCL